MDTQASLPSTMAYSPDGPIMVFALTNIANSKLNRSLCSLNSASWLSNRTLFD